MQRLRSMRHRFWLGVSGRVRWSRGLRLETPSRELPALSGEQAARVAALQGRFAVRFELTMTSATARNNYEYLDILERAWCGAGSAAPRGGRLTDIGCASFWYAAALDRFFRPRQLVGVEVDAHRLLRDGHARIDHAHGYLSVMGHARFLAADYGALDLPAEVITAWFPFVTPAAILAWRLPLSLLAPEAIFRRVACNLCPGGVFFMVNHGSAEAAAASALCSAAGLRAISRCAEPGVLSAHRHQPAIVSIWNRA